MKPNASCFLSQLIELFSFFFQKKKKNCVSHYSFSSKNDDTNVSFSRGLNYRKTVETDNTDFCC